MQRYNICGSIWPRNYGVLVKFEDAASEINELKDEIRKHKTTINRLEEKLKVRREQHDVLKSRLLFVHKKAIELQHHVQGLRDTFQKSKESR